MAALIMSSDYVNASSPQLWSAIEKSAKPASWKFAENKIQETTISGGRSIQSGSLLISKSSLPTQCTGIRLGFRPGSVGHSGLVFNFLDEDNFSLFVLNQGRTGSNSYTIQIVRVVGGRDEEVFREKRAGGAETDSLIELAQRSTGIEFLMNGQLQFRGDQWVLKDSFGLYVRGNSDAEFKELRLNTTNTNIVSTVSSSSPIPSPTLTNTNTVALPDSRELIDRYMQLKPPASKSNVDYRIVQVVALDTFYSSLKNMLEDPTSSYTTSKVTNVQLLDFRPRRWYRRLREINELIALQEKVIGKKMRLRDMADNHLDKKLEEIEAGGDYKPEDIVGMETLYSTYVGDHLIARRTIEDLQDEKLDMIREIRTNGYFLDDVGQEESPRFSGYDFAIRKAKHGLPAFEPIMVGQGVDYSNEKQWQETEGLLFLAARDLMKSNQRQQYDLEKAQLVSAEGCAELQRGLSSIRESIGNVQGRLEGMARSISAYDSEIQAWSSDANKMQERINRVSQLDTFVIPAHDWNEIWHWFPQNANGTQEESHETAVLNSVLYSWFSNPNILGLPLAYQLNRLRILQSCLEAKKQERIYRNPNINDSIVLDTGARYYTIVIISPHDQIAASAKVLKYDIPSPGGWDFTNNYFWLNRDHTLRDVFQHGLTICNFYIGANQAAKASAQTEYSKLTLELHLLQNQLLQETKTGLSNQRLQFLTKWNAVETYLGEFKFETIFPDTDPLAAFLIETNAASGTETTETFIFTPTENGYMNQNGQTIVDFLNTIANAQKSTVALFPVPDGSGGFSDELIKVVRNPRNSSVPATLPVIKFVESYRIGIRWQGYALGELSHSLNLAPGETKELTVEKKTRITTKTEEITKKETNRSEKLTSSFEENLQDTFSSENKSEQKLESKTKQDSTKATSTESTQSSDITAKFDFDSKVSGSGLLASASATIGFHYNSNSKSSLNNKSAFNIAQSNEGTKSSNQSSDIMRKNVSNTVRKVANETSLNNKLEFSSISSSEISSEVSDKEVIRLENPNVGRTVNFNFFQLQNCYGITISLTDVKLIINSGQELIEGTGINDIRVYELEEFGKVYANSGHDVNDKFVASVIARQVMKSYGNFLPGVTRGNGAVALPPGYVPDREALEVLNYSAESLTNNITKEALLAKLDAALEVLKGMPFHFKETIVQEETTETVNTGAYHMESQVGMHPATEEYLEVRRDIETEKNRKEVEMLQARIEAKAFWPPAGQVASQANTNVTPSQGA